ncbi:MAG: hypothetical protein QOH04_2383 [Sphingomonadales bacterium]|nr:hypothetical protein [Sphingomonadales bacterium]
MFCTAGLLLLGSGCGGGGSEASDPAPVVVPVPPPPPPPPCPNALGDGTNSRKDGDDCLATFRDSDGAGYDARQLDHSLGWLVEANAPLDGLLVFGQSNAGLFVASDINSNLHAPLFPHTVVGSSLGYWGDNTTIRPPVAAAPFQDLYDPPSLIGHYPATLDAYAAERVARDGGRAPTGLYAYSQFQPGQPITSFVRGTTNYQDLLDDVRRTVASAKLYKRTFVVRGIVWIQGETPSGNYEAMLETLADNVAEDIKAITGQSGRPELMIQQINTPDAQPAITGVELAQLALARRRFGSGITLIGPMYQGRFGANDPQHVSDLGKMALADVAGLAFDRIRRGLTFTPLWPVAVSRAGAVIDVRFALPGNGLAFDADFVPATPDFGFVYHEPASPAKVASVAIVAPDTVRITLDRVPVGPGLLEYALGNETATDRFAAGRGNLYSEDNAISVYWRLGYPVPKKVRHYAVRFQEGVP